MSQPAPRKQIVAKEILEHAARLFAEKGFEGTSLQDIADAVGLSRPALYYYFRSKRAFLEALIEDVTLSAVRTLAEIRNDSGRSPRDRLHRAVESMVLWVLERPTRFKVTDRAEAQLPPELAERHNAAKHEVLDIISGLIREGIAAGELRPVHDRVAALSVIGMSNWTAWWFSPGKALSKEQVAAMIADLALSALSRPTGERVPLDNLGDAIRALRDDLTFLENLVNES